MKSVAFELVDAGAVLRHSVAGKEIQISAGGRYATADEREIAALDAHPAVKRAKSAKRAKAAKPAAPVASAPEENA